MTGPATKKPISTVRTVPYTVQIPEPTRDGSCRAACPFRPISERARTAEYRCLIGLAVDTRTNIAPGPNCPARMVGNQP